MAFVRGPRIISLRQPVYTLAQVKAAYRRFRAEYGRWPTYAEVARPWPERPAYLPTISPLRRYGWTYAAFLMLLERDVPFHP